MATTRRRSITRSSTSRAPRTRNAREDTAEWKRREREIARGRRVYEAEQRKRDRKHAAAARISARELADAGRMEYARLAKEKPYEKFKYHGTPYPVFGPPRTQITIGSGAGASKIAKRLPKNIDPALERARKASNDLRVRELKGQLHDLEIDVRHAEFAYRGTKPGTKTHDTKKAAYKRLQARYDRLFAQYRAAYDRAAKTRRAT